MKCYEAIREVVVAMAENEPRLRIAKHEADETMEYEPEAHEFLKLDGKRIGRDFMLYELMSKGGDIGTSLADFAEPLMAVKVAVPSAFENARHLVEAWAKHYEGELADEWLQLWS